MTPPHDSKSMLTPDPDQGMVGTPAACARMVEPILSPSAAMASAGGPRNLMPVSASAVGSSGFSEAWPLHTAQHRFHPPEPDLSRTLYIASATAPARQFRNVIIADSTVAASHDAKALLRSLC